MSGAKSFFARGELKPMPASEDISAFLGKETVFEGKMTFQGVFRLDGKFEGEIFESGTLIVGEMALIKGKVGVHTLVILGHVEGEVHATARVEIHSNGTLRGNLFTPVLVINEGGLLDGNCKMEGSPGKGEDSHLVPKTTEDPSLT